MISPFACNGLREGRLPCLHDIVEWPDRKSTHRPRNFASSALQNWGTFRPSQDFRECAFFREIALQRAAFCCRRCPHAFIPSFKSAAQLLVGCRIEKDFSHLALPPSGGDAFARPCHRLVHVSAFQYPKTADVFLGLKIRPVGDEHLAIGLPS